MFKIAIVGCGRISQSHLSACESIKEIKLVAVVDTNKLAYQSVAEDFHCKGYGDYKKMLASENLDAVIICTPPSTHEQIALAVLGKGLHVLCEKPLTITLHNAKNMYAKANKVKRLLMMASKFRFTADVIKAKSMIESGVIGDPVLYENVFCSFVDMTSRWNSDKTVSGGGVLRDNGPHSIDIARFLLGDIKEIYALAAKKIQSTKVEDTVKLLFKSAKNTAGAIDLSWSINKHTDYYISIYGTEGTIHIGWKKSCYIRSDNNEDVVFGKGYNKIEAFQKQLIHFVNCAGHKEKPLITEKDAVESVKAIEAAYRSTAKGRWEAVK